MAASPLGLPGGVTINDPQQKYGDLGSLVSGLIPYIFPAAGLVLLFMIIAGGFQLLTSAGNPENTAKGYKKILFAIIGFVVIFTSYWLIQILEDIFNLEIF